MASTNKTEKLHLSQFVASDKPSWLNDYNEDMRKIDGVIDSVVEKIYPVGSYYISAVATSPAQLFGFGTWAQVKGRMLIGVDEDNEEFNGPGKEGGATKIKLTKNEIPNITGRIEFHGIGNGSCVNTVGGAFRAGSIRAGKHMDGGTSQNASQSVEIIEFDAGCSGNSFSNMNPYETAYIWKRTA